MPSKLEAFVNTKKNTKTNTITARVPSDKYLLFKKKCTDLGLSISEAINILIDTEIEYEVPAKNEDIMYFKNEDKPYSKDEDKNEDDLYSYPEDEDDTKPKYKMMYDFDDEDEEEDTTCINIVDIPEWQLRELEEQRKPTVIEDPVHEVVTNEQILKEILEMKEEEFLKPNKPNKPTKLDNDNYRPF